MKLISLLIFASVASLCSISSAQVNRGFQFSWQASRVYNPPVTRYYNSTPVRICSPIASHFYSAPEVFVQVQQPVYRNYTRQTVSAAYVSPNTRLAYIQHVTNHPTGVSVPYSVAAAANMTELIQYHSNLHAGLSWSADTTVITSLNSGRYSSRHSAPPALLRRR